MISYLYNYLQAIYLLRKMPYIEPKAEYELPEYDSDNVTEVIYEPNKSNP